MQLLRQIRQKIQQKNLLYKATWNLYYWSSHRTGEEANLGSCNSCDTEIQLCWECHCSWQGWDWSQRPPHSPAESRDTWAGKKLCPRPTWAQTPPWAKAPGQVRILGATKAHQSSLGFEENFRTRFEQAPRKSLVSAQLREEQIRAGLFSIKNPSTQSCPQFTTRVLAHNHFVPCEHSMLSRSGSHRD